MNNFIEEYRIDSKLCDDIVNHFTLSNDKIKGRAGDGRIQETVKKSTDLYISPTEELYPFNKYRVELQNCLEKYVIKYPELNKHDRFNVNTTYNIQHYKPNEGFYEWHNERMGLFESNRILVFMTYLNTVDDAGTDFKYYNYKTKAIKGNTLIWPTDFTHTHKGQISAKQEKYIITGWFTFNE